MNVASQMIRPNRVAAYFGPLRLTKPAFIKFETLE
jgi:hypothetical protein